MAVKFVLEEPTKKITLKFIQPWHDLLVQLGYRYNTDYNMVLNITIEHGMLVYWALGMSKSMIDGRKVENMAEFSDTARNIIQLYTSPFQPFLMNYQKEYFDHLEEKRGQIGLFVDSEETTLKTYKIKKPLVSYMKKISKKLEVTMSEIVLEYVMTGVALHTFMDRDDIIDKQFTHDHKACAMYFQNWRLGLDGGEMRLVWDSDRSFVLPKEHKMVEPYSKWNK